MNGLAALMARSTPPTGIPANTLLRQPGARYHRINDALELLDSTNGAVTLQQQITALQGQLSAAQGQIATLQGQVGTLQGQVAAVTTTANNNAAAIAVLQQRLANAGIP